MRDINFFSVYTKRKNGLSTKAIAVLLVIAGVCILVGGSYLALVLHLSRIKNETRGIDLYLQSDEVKATLNAIEVHRANDGILTNYGAIIDEVLTNLKASDFINAARLDEISAALPVDVVMTNLEVTDNTAIFAYNVADVAMAAQLIAALTEVDSIETITLSGVTGSDTGIGYSVTLTARLKGGAAE